MNLNNDNPLWKSALIVYYDLEFSGNIRLEFGKKCSIHQIAAQTRKDHFYCQINPYLTKETVEPPVDPKYHMPSEEEFLTMSAYSFPDAYNSFVAFLYRLLLKRNKTWVCLVSHNGFRGDKIVLEHEIQSHGLPTLPFFFFDSLLYLREVSPGMPSYSLPNVYQDVFGVAYNAHTACADTQALMRIIKHINQPLHGVLYSMHTIPWRNVGGIGYHTEQTFLNHGLFDLTALYSLCCGTEEKTRDYLHSQGIVLTEKTLANIFHWYKLADTVIQRQQNHVAPTTAYLQHSV